MQMRAAAIRNIRGPEENFEGPEENFEGAERNFEAAEENFEGAKENIGVDISNIDAKTAIIAKNQGLTAFILPPSSLIQKKTGPNAPAPDLSMRL